MSGMLSVMVDCSRNSVMKPSAVKRFADCLAKMGYNSLMLYTEDTFELDGEPLFGYMRGRYTKDELKDIDDYCNSIGIELIPCVQTLAHLNCIFKWSEYGSVRDCDDILLIDEPKTYELIEKIIKTCAECFRSRRIHIGMDEAHNVGFGKYAYIHGMPTDRFALMQSHLNKVCEIVKSYGFKPMMWSDMMITHAYGTKYNQLEKIIGKTPNHTMNDEVELVYWDYYSADYDHYAGMIDAHKKLGAPTIFAGAAWSWRGIAPHNGLSTYFMTPALRACRDKGVDEIIVTMWGDDGGECSNFALLPCLYNIAQMYHGNNDETAIKEGFYKLFHVDYDQMSALDKPSAARNEHDCDPAIYLFYNDLLCGLNDFRCTAEDNEFYGSLRDEYNSVTERGDFGYIFDAVAKLCDVLSVKCDMGVRIRNAYKSGDRETLETIINKDIPDLIERIEVFHDSYEKMWLTDNKPFGFDVQDIRVGGLIQRIKACKKRISEWLGGEIDIIDELEAELVPAKTGYSWAKYTTANVVTHELY